MPGRVPCTKAWMAKATLKAGVPELRRAAGRLSELLEGSVY